MAGNIVPRTDGGSNLGTADKEFNVIYAKSFGGTIASQVVTTNSPTFTGTPAAPTAAAGTNTTQIATTAFANAAASAAASSAVSTHNLASDAHSATIAAAVNTHNAATDAHSTEFAKYLPLSGGAISGAISRDTDDNSMFLSGGTDYAKGAWFRLAGKDNVYNGDFTLCAYGNKALIGKPDGTLTWAGTPIKSMAFPSATKVNVALAGYNTTTTYTTPANGYVFVSARNTAATTGSFSVATIDNGVMSMRCVANGSNYVQVSIPVSKGKTISIGINNCDIGICYFIYAEGEV